MHLEIFNNASAARIASFPPFALDLYLLAPVGIIYSWRSALVDVEVKYASPLTNRAVVDGRRCSLVCQLVRLVVSPDWKSGIQLFINRSKPPSGDHALGVWLWFPDMETSTSCSRKA
jgi:hypothetical protein